MFSDRSLRILNFLLQNSDKLDGITIKTETNAHPTPTVIIRPKSITGLILLVIRERNAAIVVNIVYKHGLNIVFTIIFTFSLVLCASEVLESSLNRTIK